MSAEIIGRVKAGSGKSYEVKWDSSNREVYVSCSGWSACGKASSAGDAMRKAEAFLYNK
jgi:Tfp pilus assembly protein PilV